MTCYALRARHLLPIITPPIPDGVITIDDASGRIVDVGNRPPAGTAVTDLGDVVLMPGLVNAHTHLEFSQLKRPLGEPGISLPAWIRSVLAQRKGQEDVLAALTAGIVESLANGVTAIGEIATGDWPAYEACAPPVDMLVLREVIGFSTPRASSAYVEAERSVQEFQAGISAAEPRLPFAMGLSPHAPYTVHPHLVVDLVSLAGKRQLPIAMHLAESAEELQLLDSGGGPFAELLRERSMWDATAIPPSSRPLDYLRLLALAPHALVIHGNYLADEELDFLAEKSDSMSLVYCPRTHKYFQHPPYPLQRALRAGVRVIVGTDSRASTANLSVLDELREIHRSHPLVAPSQVLRLGTAEAAEALGFGKFAGSLSAGRVANLTAVPCDPDERDAHEAVLANASPPCATWLRGYLWQPPSI